MGFHPGDDLVVDLLGFRGCWFRAGFRGSGGEEGFGLRWLGEREGTRRVSFWKFQFVRFGSSVCFLQLVPSLGNKPESAQIPVA